MSFKEIKFCSYSISKFSVLISYVFSGLKNILFDECLVRDALFMAAGSGFMIICIWSYTGSLFITLCTVLAIGMSFIISYFIYTFIFNIKFFPFMNMLAIIVAIGEFLVFKAYIFIRKFIELLSLQFVVKSLFSLILWKIY